MLTNFALILVILNNFELKTNIMSFKNQNSDQFYINLCHFDLKTNILTFKNLNLDQFSINACDFDDFLPQNQHFAL